MVCNYQLHTTRHGAIKGKSQSKEVVFYNLDMILAIGYRVRSPREDILQGNGKTTNQKMIEKVEIEYKKFREKNLIQVERDYLEEIKNIERLAKENSKKK